jgi:hypothetical protein
MSAVIRQAVTVFLTRPQAKTASKQSHLATYGVAGDEVWVAAITCACGHVIHVSHLEFSAITCPKCLATIRVGE